MEFKDCVVCDGTGVIEYDGASVTEVDYDGYDWCMDTCDACLGAGEVPDGPR